jgi:hypothetical protein
MRLHASGFMCIEEITCHARRKTELLVTSRGGITVIAAMMVLCARPISVTSDLK